MLELEVEEKNKKWERKENLFKRTNTLTFIFVKLGTLYVSKNIFVNNGILSWHQAYFGWN